MGENYSITIQNLYVTNSHFSYIGGFASTSTIKVDHSVVTEENKTRHSICHQQYTVQ